LAQSASTWIIEIFHVDAILRHTFIATTSFALLPLLAFTPSSITSFFHRRLILNLDLPSSNTTFFFLFVFRVLFFDISTMKTFTVALAFLTASLISVGGGGVHAFVSPQPTTTRAPLQRRSAALAAKYNSMDEILALFPADKPVLVNFYDAATEADIKDDIFRAKKLLEDRATLVRYVLCGSLVARLLPCRASSRL